MATLEQIDWCLQQLEGVDSAKAMGGQLAQDKFHRLLSSKLSNMSEHSKSGHQLAEWVQDITRSTNGEGTHTFHDCEIRLCILEGITGSHYIMACVLVTHTPKVFRPIRNVWISNLWPVVIHNVTLTLCLPFNFGISLRVCAVPVSSSMLIAF